MLCHACRGPVVPPPLRACGEVGQPKQCRAVLLRPPAQAGAKLPGAAPECPEAEETGQLLRNPTVSLPFLHAHVFLWLQESTQATTEIGQQSHNSTASLTVFLLHGCWLCVAAVA